MNPDYLWPVLRRRTVLLVRRRRRPLPRPLVLLLTCSGPAAAQPGPDPLWMTQLGSAGNDIALAAAPDGAGGSLAAGWTTGPLGGPFAGGDRDPWLGRWDSEGQRMWLRQFGTSVDDYVQCVASDGAVATVGGAVFVFADRASDALVARYDGSGNQIWRRQFGTPQADWVEAVCGDGAGGSFVAGGTAGALGGAYAGGETDAFVARLDASGARLWTRQLGTDAEFGEFASAIAPDGAGGVFVTGSTNGALGGPSHGFADVWLARYSAGGDLLWIQQFGTTRGDSAAAAAPDGAGGVYIGGSTRLSLGAPSAGSFDAWVARFTGDGERLWIDQFGSSAIEGVQAIDSDGSAVFLVGWTSGDLGSGSAGATDAWLARYDASGARAWIAQFGVGADDQAHGVACDGAGGVVAAGWTGGSLARPSAGGDDVWIARFPADACPADCDGSGDLTFFDFLCFQNLFAAGDPAADCDGDGSLTFFDFLCFQNAFAAGCP